MSKYWSNQLTGETRFSNRPLTLERGIGGFLISEWDGDFIGVTDGQIKVWTYDIPELMENIHSKTNYYSKECCLEFVDDQVEIWSYRCSSYKESHPYKDLLNLCELMQIVIDLGEEAFENE